ncbi:hypothetical protein PENTCL1PPCAC_7805, partial [Pristionchus entomophagus]
LSPMQSYLSISIEELPLPLKLLLYFIHFTEFLLIFTSVSLMIFAMKVLLNSAVFHIHLSVMFCIAFSVYTLSTIGRLILMLFELHLIDPDGGTEDPLLIRASFLRLYGIFYLIFGLFGFTGERACATYWCEDYERKTRWWIVPLISSVAFFGSFALSYSVLFDIMTWATLLIVAGVINLLGLVPFLLLFRYNRRKWAAMRNFEERETISLNGYELSKRFQLLENIRVSKLLYKMAIPLFFNYLLITAFYFSHLLCTIPYISHISLSLFDMWIALFATSVPLMGNALESSWRATVRRMTRGAKRVGVYTNKERPKEDARHNTNLYFAHLTQIWD